LQKAITSYNNAQQKTNVLDFDKDLFPSEEEFMRTLRDSMIQKFEFSVDIFWKFLKDYLEDVEHITLDIRSPKATFRAMCNSRLISKKDAELAIEIVKHRNLSSHIYKEEIAEMISELIPFYFSLMEKVLSTISIRQE